MSKSSYPRVSTADAPAWFTTQHADERVSRHRSLPQFGDSAINRLRQSKVAVIGAGGLGSPVIQYLAATGVGRLDIFDDQQVEMSNLNRQVIHSAEDEHTGVTKVANAIATVERIAPDVEATGHQVRLTSENVVNILSDCDPDVIVDGSDSFNTRFLVSYAAQTLGVPVVFGALQQFAAQMTVFDSTANPPLVLTDVFADTPATRATPGCAETGILGSVAGMAGSILATETIKYLTGVGQSLLGRMLIIDTLNATVREIPLGASAPENVSAALPGVLGSAVSTIQPPVIRGIDPDSVSTWVDVRRAEEVAETPGLAGSVNIPLDELLGELDRTGTHPKLPDTEFGVLCQSGPRSIKAARALQAAEYPVLGFLDGGMSHVRAH